MGKQEKLLDRLFTIPADFTWSELTSLLTGLGFQEKQGSGSRVKFFHPESRTVISLHKPHPNNEIGRNTARDIVSTLKGIGIEP